jgi:hypothetical protein
VFAKPSRQLLMDWVLDAWAAVPEDLIQRGMKDLIVDFALKSDPPANPVPVPVVSPPPPAAEQDAALSVLDTMGSQNVERVDVPDEESSDESENSETELIEKEPTELSVCMMCERPLRMPHVVKCVPCGISFHPGCVSFSSSGKCMLCP